jgi:hypothetical protein
MSNSEINLGLIQKTLNSFDWEDIGKMYKILGLKIGTQPIKIDGLNKKEKTNPDSIKKEVELVLNYIVSNDIPELKYGPWIIYWVNGEWEMEIESEDQGGEPLIVPIMESKMEIHFIPQSSTIKELLDIDLDEDYDEDISDKEQEILYFESRLKKAIDSEDWMVASRLRDLIEEIKKSENEN